MIEISQTVRQERSGLQELLTKPAYSVPELQQLTSIGRSFLYEEIRQGRLRATKAGRRTLFLADDVVAWLEGMRE